MVEDESTMLTRRSPWFAKSLAALTICLATLLAGCTPTPSYELKPGADKTPLSTTEGQDTIAALDTQLSNSMANGADEFKLGPGDVLKVYFYVDSALPQDEYTIRAGDKLNVAFYNQPKANLSVLVRPDGRVSLPLKGDVVAAGLRPADLAKNIAQAYSDIMVDPAVTVNLQAVSSPTDRFIKMIQSSTTGQVVEAKVAPDGMLTLAMLPTVDVSGLTVAQLQERLNTLYRKTFAALRATVTLKEAAPRPVYVFGEVRNPGAIAANRPAGQPLTIMQSIVDAGGPLATADMQQVLVLYWKQGSPTVLRKSNVMAAMEELKLGEEMLVPPRSIVYVPPTALTVADRWVDQVVRQLLLFNGVGVGVNYNHEQKR
jgi:protein involved in polysaccharide export with SLBB domain